MRATWALVLVGVIGAVGNLHGQPFRQEVSLGIDNDVIFFTDRYYTAGQEIAYRRVAANPDSARKRIWHVSLGSKFFTAQDTRIKVPDIMHRPYAGYVFSRGGYARYRRNTYWQFGLEGGFVGEALGFDKVQIQWHRMLNLRQPLGWRYQLPNEWVLNAWTEAAWSFRVAPEIDFVPWLRAEAGTASTRLTAQGFLRILEPRPLGESALVHGRLGQAHAFEFFVMGGYGIDYVIHSLFVHGSLFQSHENPVATDPARWVPHGHLALFITSARSTLSLRVYRLAPEVRNGLPHTFSNLHYAYRFR